MDNEKIAISELSLLVSKTNRLQSFVTDGDREPHWDGYIHVFSSSEKKSTQSVGRVPVQVKSISQRRFHKKNPTFKARVSDLKQYLEEGGAIYVVGVISPHKTCKLFYQTLLPFELILLLKNIEENQQWKNISLDILPTNPNTLEDLFYAFLKNRKIQLPMSSAPRTHPCMLQQKWEQTPTSKLTLDFWSMNQTLITAGSVSPFPHYIYESNKDGQRVPIAKAEVIVANIRELVNKPIICGDKVFYKSFTQISCQSNCILQIGTCFRYIIPSVNNSGKSYGYFEESGTLQERLHGANFTLAALQNHGFKAGDDFFGLSLEYGEEMAKKKNVEDFINSMCDICAGLKKAGFADDLDLDNLSNAAWEEIQFFAKNIQSGIPIPLSSDNENLLIMDDQFINVLSCGPLNFALLCSPACKGHYYCENLFYTKPEVEINGIKTPIIPYLLIDPNKLPYVDNLNYQELINSFDEIPHDSFSENKVDALLLALLTAYDKTGKQEQLHAADRMSSWLLESQTKASEPNCLLNRYQTTLRQRELNDEEIEKILGLIEDSAVSQIIKIGAYILLDNDVAVKVGLSRLSESERLEFEASPIYSLFTKRNIAGPQL